MKKVLFFTAFLVLFFASCTNDPPASEQTTTEPVTAVAVEPSSVKILCQPVAGTSDSDTPKHEVFLQIGDNKIKVADINACETITPDLYHNYTIPKEALDAAGGWWAGQGDYVYVIREGDNYVVKQGWMAEEQDDQGYHFKTVLTFAKDGKQVL